MKAVTPLPQNAKEAMMTTAERLRKEGLEQGEARGLAQGALTKAREDAQRMLDKGYPLEDISEITGLSREEVEGLRKG